MKKSNFILLFMMIGSLQYGSEKKLILFNKQEIYEKSLLMKLIKSVALDREKNIYVLDGDACRVDKFTSKGKYLLSFGRPGQGPGDLRMPSELAVTDKNEIAVSTRLDGIRYFDTNGKYIDRPLLPGNPIKPIWIGGNVYCCEKRSGIIGRKQIIIDGSGKTILDDVNQIEMANVSLPNGGLFARLNPDYSPLLFATSEFGLAALANSTRYRITLVNSLGKIMKIIERDVPKVPISAAERSWLKEQIGKDTPQEAQQALINLIPENKNFIGGLCLSPTQIWVRRFVGNIWDEDKLRTIDVLTLDGQFVATVELKHLPLLITADAIFCVEEDEEGGPLLVKYSYSWQER